MVGCGVKPDDFKVNSVVGVELNSVNSANIVVNVTNSSRFNAEIKNFKIDISSNDKTVVEIIVATPVEIPKRTTTNVTIPLRIRLVNPIMAIKAFKGLGQENSNTTIKGSGVCKLGLATKKIDIDSQNLGQMINRLGLDNTQLSNLLSF